MFGRHISIAWWSLSLFATLVHGQIIVDRRPELPFSRTYEIAEMTVDAAVREQVAQVQVGQVFRNPGSVVLEAEYFFPLPDDATVQNVVLMVDGKEIPGRILPKDEARRTYEEIVRTKRDPALLEYMGRGLFRTSVFPIPPGQSRTVNLRTTYLCRRDHDMVDFSYPLATQKHSAKPIGRLAVNVSIDSKLALKTVYSPSHTVAIQRPDDHRATARYEQQNSTPSGDFRLFYSVADGAVGATVLSYRPSDTEDGYFLLLASPSVKQEQAKPIAKTVIVVLDRSGSMSGKKIEQARDAVRFVLNNLRDGDLFNIVAYDAQVEAFKPELQRFTSATRTESLAFVDNIRAGGSTNIEEALKTALAMIQDREGPNYVLFLTDGLPTTGEIRETVIAENVKSANRLGTRLFVFGVGYDVNSRLLDRLSGGNGGVSEYVKPEDNLESALSHFYGRMSSPVLTQIGIAWSGTDVNCTYPQALPDLFEGGQLIWVGRYRQSGSSKLVLTGKVGNEEYRLNVATELATAGRGSNYAFVERLWATRRIGAIIDDLDLHGQNQELVNELVALSTQYGILTPYTSFLADERVHLFDQAKNQHSASESARQLSTVGGQSGFEQRAYKNSLMQSASPASAASAPYGGPNKDIQTVRQLGTKNFFYKNGRWIDAAVSSAEDSKAEVLEQFSDDYFRLARAQTAEMNQYLTFDGELTVKLGNRVYRIAQAKK